MQAKVEECPHFVINQAPRHAVHDENRMPRLQRRSAVLEITYKNGQVWQLFRPAAIYGEIGTRPSGRL
jgi:hypothetical protein